MILGCKFATRSFPPLLHRKRKGVIVNTVHLKDVPVHSGFELASEAGSGETARKFWPRPSPVLVGYPDTKDGSTEPSEHFDKPGQVLCEDQYGHVHYFPKETLVLT